MKVFVKRSRIMLLVVLVTLLLVAAVPLQANETPVNGSDIIATKAPAQAVPTDAQILKQVQEMLPGFSADSPTAVSCQILDSSGAATTTINQANYGSAANWFSYSSGGAASSTVNFWARPYYSPAVLKTVFQSFDVTSSPTTNIVTPFGIPFWGGGLTSGVWLLVVYNDTGLGNYCVFTVT